MLTIYKYKNLSLNITLIIIFIPLIFYSGIVVSIFFLLLSNLFDILGYYYVLTRKGKEYPEKEIRSSYRIIQFLFDVLLLVLLALQFGLIPSLAGAAMKITGAQDLLYYYFLKMPLPEKWTWMKFTPYGFIKKIISKKEVIIQAILGVIVAIILFYFVKL